MFKEIIDDYLSNVDSSRGSRPNNRHWPSEASLIVNTGSGNEVVGRCIREQYLSRKLYPVDKYITVENMRKMDVGKAIEQCEIGYGKSCGIWIADDVPFQMDLGYILISGRLDAIYNYNGIPICVEYKTSAGYTFEQEVYGKFGKLKAMPRPEHVIQVMIYLEARKDIQEAIIFYVNRQNMDVIEHHVMLSGNTAVVNGDLTRYTLDGIYRRYAELTMYLDSNVLPPMDFTPLYKNDDVEDLYRSGSIGKKAYDDWLTTDKLPGHWRCVNLCAYRKTCAEYREQAMPGKINNEEMPATQSSK